MEFRRLTISDKQHYESYLNADNSINSVYCASELNFSNLFCWNVSDNIWYSPQEEALYIMAKDDSGTYFLPPLVRRDEDFLPAMKNIERYFKEKQMPFLVRSATKEMLEVLGDARQNYRIEYNRDYSEYLYHAKDLVDLSGKKYDAKRNHLNYFKSHFDYTFRPFEKRDKQDIINLVYEWKIYSGATEILEQTAIDTALAFYEELGLSCDVLEADGKLIGFAIGFVNRNNVGVVMFEKADANYRGSYAAVNNLFARDRLAECTFVNRQEDLGIEGLRKAKLSYHPAGMADKYDLTKER